MEVDSQFHDCTNLTIPKLERANLISVITSSVSFFLLLLFLSLLALYRAYKTTLQRLFLYLTITTTLDAMVTILDIELRFDADHNLKFCEWIGFCDVWTSNLIELFNFAFTVYLTTTAYQRFKGREVKCLGSCRKHPVLTEIISVLAIVFFPLSYLWIPFYHHTYGLGETVCWIKEFDENCKKVDNFATDSTMLEIIDTSSHTIVIISFSMLIVFLSMLLVKLRHSKKETVETIGRVLFLIVILGLSMGVRIAQFGVNLSTHYFNVTVNDFAYNTISDCAYTVSNLLVPLGFAVYLFSPKKLSTKSLRRAAKKWIRCRCCRSHRRETRKRRARSDPRYAGIIDDDGLESAEVSSEQEYPSHTTGYSSPYTNQFTHITEILNSQECKSTPKYGSIHTTQ